MTILRYLVAVGLLLPGVAQAQPRSVSAEAEAAEAADVQRSFGAGNAALRAGRFHEARDLLREAHRGANAVGTAFNLAVALRGTGEVSECAALFDRLLLGAFGEVTADVGAQSESLREECRAAVATLAVRVTHGAVVRVDGQAIGRVEPGAPRELRLDPGPHVVTAAERGFVTAEERVVLGRSERGAVEIRLVPAITLALSTASPTSVDERAATVFEEAWFWGLVIGVALAAGGVALGVALTPPSVAEPIGSPWSEPRVVP